MKVLGYILLAGIILSVVQAALSALVVVLLILGLFGMFAYPAETFGFALLGLMNWLFHTHPMAATGVASLLILAAVTMPAGRGD